MPSRTDNHTIPIATVREHDTSLEPFAGSVCVGKRRDRIVFSVDEEDPVPSLDALETACEALYGVNLPARRRSNRCVIEIERADAFLVFYS
jgi:hypothetical protein